jgi:hypothetical protein
MLVVDVQRNCIAQICAKQRYLALSYIWGAVTSFQALKSNINDLIEGCLLHLSDTIPSVIRGAIRLTKDLGEK